MDSRGRRQDKLLMMGLMCGAKIQTIMYNIIIKN